jgi:hypothetical protein
MGRRHSQSDLSDSTPEEELNELGRQTTPSPKRTKTPLKEGHKAKSKSAGTEIDDGDTVDESARSTSKKIKMPARSGRGVAHVVEKGDVSLRSKAPAKKEGGTARSGELVRPKIKSSPPNLLPGYTDTSDEDEANEDDTPESTPETEQVTPIKKSAGPGPTVLKMTTKISKLAENIFEVAELWEGFLARHTPREENSLTKVREAMDKIAGKRKAVGGGDNEEGGSSRKKAKRYQVNT